MKPMQLPSIIRLAKQSRDVLQRFPWTMLAASVAAAAAIVATTKSADDAWGRLAMVAALGLALTVALTLLAEERRLSPDRHHGTECGRYRTPGAPLLRLARTGAKA